MEKLKFLATIIFTTLLVISCSNDDDTPQAVNEEEIITTMTVTLLPNTGGTAITLQTIDLDGDGPNAPVITVSGNLAANTTYNGTILLLNETLNPAENITSEVEEEGKEHQFFYTISTGLNATTTYTSFDTDGNPLGIQFDLETGNASSGTITFTLRHEPSKPNSGLSDAGGETDISATFNVTIQ